MKTEKLLPILILIVGILWQGTYAQTSRVQEYANEMDATQNLYAKRWSEAFKKLDAKNNISIVISLDENLVEIENVYQVEAFSRFLIVQTKHKNGKRYKSIVYPGTILYIKESAP